jgi:hypothetical protein
MNYDKLRDLMTAELEIQYNQAQRRGSRAPAPSQIIEAMLNVVAQFIAAAQPEASTRKSRSADK